MNSEFSSGEPTRSIAAVRACNICGSTAFLPGFLGRFSNGLPPRCGGCHSVERHRAVHRIYSRLTTLSGKWRVLHFAPDASVNPKWFASYRGSIYGTASSLDIMATKLPDRSFDVVMANHVLEHVSDYLGGITEMLRLVDEGGFVHVTVPAQAWELVDWGFADPSKNEHWREFGADFALSVLAQFRDLHALGVVGGDPITGAADMIYLFSRTTSSLRQVAGILPRAGIQVVRFG